MAEQLVSGEKAPKEIERKFLVTEVPVTPDSFNYEKIRQGYLANDEYGAVRVRQKGERFYITYKGVTGVHAAERVELETELTEEQFSVLWPGTEGRRVEKTRYTIPYGANTIELDLFEGQDAGNILAEVEFASTAEADEFIVPAWFGTDVTADKRYGNASIAENGFPS